MRAGTPVAANLDVSFAARKDHRFTGPWGFLWGKKKSPNRKEVVTPGRYRFHQCQQKIMKIERKKNQRHTLIE